MNKKRAALINKSTASSEPKVRDFLSGGVLNPSTRINCPWFYALIPRTAALFIVLYQIRLLAGDLADTSFFVTALAAALVIALCLFIKGIKSLPAFIVIVLVPWAARFLIALPRLFSTGFRTNLLLDSLLLNLDRNNFCALFPFYWTAVSSFFSLKSREFLRGEIIAADVFFLVLFSITPTVSMETYRWPVVMIALFGSVFFMQAVAFILSIPPEMRLRKAEGLTAVFALLLLAAAGGALLVRPSQEKAAERGGGLIEPKMFRFDFSQILRLDPEISVTDDLALIVKKEPDDYRLLLRRYTISGYSKKQGFYRMEDIDEGAHPGTLPDRPVTLKDEDFLKSRISNQEYYAVNIDSSAFVGMNAPLEITPFETWDASSFNSAYAVKSRVSEALPFDLFENDSGEADGGLTPEERRVYTEYGGDIEIARYAAEITGGITGKWEKIEAVYDHLKYGDYRYSFKPGIAPDGDQLKYFLFDAKKGYCSYFAFAFTLLVRSMGIPCRLAVGYSMDPETNAFNYYPVRSDMAHAWTEVWFPSYGWIEYDPTSNEMAAGEEYRLSSGTPPELFERLIKEILNNHSSLKPKEGKGEEGRINSPKELILRAFFFIKNRARFILPVLLVLLFFAVRTSYYWLFLMPFKPRRKALFLWAHVKRRMRLAGAGKPADLTEAEWAVRGDKLFDGLYDLYLEGAAARFSLNYTGPVQMFKRYRVFNESYKKAVHPARRFLAWIFPPAALARGRTWLRASALLVFCLAFFGDPARAQNNGGGAEAGDYFERAMEAADAENWERAVEYLNRGSEEYPADSRFPRALGNLYHDRRLFRLAWEEYQKAAALLPGDSDIIFQLSRTAAFLNEDALSAEYLEQYLTMVPESREALGSLGWIYFKIHRQAEGVELLLDAAERLGLDADFAMTLGILYSDMFNYDEAKRWYLEAIAGADSIGDRSFSALAHYNLSILESRFYEFELARESTDASLQNLDRASGRLALGELYLRRMVLARALAEYQTAYEMDTAPLSKINLAQVSQIGGNLEQARLYAEDCLETADLSWMHSYGIDPLRYRGDIHEILEETYRGLAEEEAFTPANGITERIAHLARKVSYLFRAEVSAHLFRKYSLLSALAYSAFDASSGENHPDALNLFYRAFEPYPGRSLFYLRAARSGEENIVPKSVSEYDFREGALLKNRELIIQGLEGLDPQWQRDLIADAYSELAETGSKAEREDAAERLFALNRGSLLQKGIRLPAEIRVNGAEPKAERLIKKAAKAAGIEEARHVEPRYILNLEAGPAGEIRCSLYDGGRGIPIYSENFKISTFQAKELSDFTKTLKNGIFNGF